MRQVLRDWSAFPASATPRLLVLTGAPVADPASGFPSGTAKLAYLEGAFNLPSSLPVGPATAAGFPLITAREATGVLKSVAAKGPPLTSRLAVTGVRLGTAVFDTDRGPRQLPAWLFGLAGVRDPAGVLAVAPSRIFAPPRRPANPRPFVGSALLGRDGRTLTVEFTGAGSGTGPCTASYSLDQAASRTAVAVAVKEHAHGGKVACAAVGYPRRVTMVLPAPLGGRVLIDAASGVAITVTTSGPRTLRTCPSPYGPHRAVPSASTRMPGQQWRSGDAQLEASGTARLTEGSASPGSHSPPSIRSRRASASWRYGGIGPLGMSP